MPPRKQYIFRYQVEGVEHLPWLPSYIVWARSLSEARAFTKADLERHMLAKYGEPKKVTPLHGARYRMGPRIDKIMSPIFAKDISALRSYNYDIRSIILGASIKDPAPRSKYFNRLTL
jgi:hypothetical protein